MRPKRELLPWWTLVGVVVAVLGMAAESFGRQGELVSVGTQVAASLFLAYWSLHAARRAHGRQRQAWGFVAAGPLMLVGLVVLLLSRLVSQGSAASGAPHVAALVTAGTLTSLAGFILLSPPEVRGATAVRFSLDALVCAVSAFFVLWALVHPSVPKDDAFGPLGAALYPAVDVAGAVLVLLVLDLARGRVPPWYSLLALGAVVALAADTATAILQVNGGVWAADAVGDGGYLIQMMMTGLAARASTAWPPQAQRQQRFRMQWTPYLPFGVALGVAGSVYVTQGGLSAPLFWLAMTGVLLVVLRTLVLLAENNQLQQRLRETDDFKTQLLRFISHEVANPLVPLRLQAGLLREGAAREPARSWDTLGRSLERLESLSRDVRLMAMAETNTLVKSPQPADVAARVARAVAAHAGLAEQRGVTLAADLQPATVPVDAERFDQVVDNLLSNALKYTPRGGQVTVRLRPDSAGAVLEVQDSGAGLSEQQTASLFAAFSRPLGDTQPGLGLGLYLCKAIVDGHGGRISALSAGSGQGTTFRVELPAQAVPTLPDEDPLAGP